MKKILIKSLKSRAFASELLHGFFFLNFENSKGGRKIPIKIKLI
jgi:hypothetical protein